MIGTRSTSSLVAWAGEALASRRRRGLGLGLVGCCGIWSRGLGFLLRRGIVHS